MYILELSLRRSLTIGEKINVFCIPEPLEQVVNDDFISRLLFGVEWKPVLLSDNRLEENCRLLLRLPGELSESSVETVFGDELLDTSPDILERNLGGSDSLTSLATEAARTGLALVATEVPFDSWHVPILRAASGERLG